MRLRTIVAASAMFAFSLVAHSTPITGSISITGNDSFDKTSITFSNPGYVTTTSLDGISSLSSTPPTLEFATLNSFQYSSLSGQLFTTTNALTGVTATLSIVSYTAVFTPSSPGVNRSLKVTGSGLLTLTNYDPTLANFSLDSSTVGSTTSFQAIVNSPAATSALSGVTPEPASLALVGTAILGVIGAARRRFAA